MEATIDERLAPLSRDGENARSHLVQLAQGVAARAFARAASQDHDGGFPADDVAALARADLLLAPLPGAAGGSGLGIGDPDLTRRVLIAIGRGSLALGRLYEGHVNAVALVARYGSSDNLRLIRREAQGGRLSGVWMAGPPLRLERDGGRFVLAGRKLLCSGAGHIERPLVAADFENGSVMLIPRVVDAGRVDCGDWVAHGMRATATGTVDFTGLVVADDEIVGKPGDYLRAPYFRGGAWRVIAVQLGGLEAILDQHRQQLAASPHRDHPIQLARFGEALIAVETARLWVERAGQVAESPYDDANAVDAYVDLARNAFEAAAQQTMRLAQKAIGLNAFLRATPLERLVRDLSTYLRQPALDVSLASAAAFHLARGDGTP